MTGHHQPQAPVAALFTGIEKNHPPEGVEQDEGHGEERCGERATPTPSGFVATLLLLLAPAPSLTGGDEVVRRVPVDADDPRPNGVGQDVDDGEHAADDAEGQARDCAGRREPGFSPPPRAPD